MRAARAGGDIGGMRRRVASLLLVGSLSLAGCDDAPSNHDGPKPQPQNDPPPLPPEDGCLRTAGLDATPALSLAGLSRVHAIARAFGGDEDQATRISRSPS